MRQGVDWSRLREAVSGPGVDTRIWICMGRVVDDPDAVVWDEELGWLCDVLAVSGPLQGGELPLSSRVVSGAQGDDIGEHRPPRKNGLVIVFFPSGDPNEESVIIGQLHNTDDAGAPAEINGTTIDEDFASRTHLTVLPDEDLDQEWSNVRVTTSGDMKLHGEAVEVGKDGADQSYMRGNDFADAIESMVDAIGSFAQSIATATPAPPNAALTVADVLAAYAPLEIAIGQFKAEREQYLSQRIKGD